MTDETTEAFAKRLAEECYWGLKYEEEWHEDESVPLLRERDEAMKMAGKREVLEELSKALGHFYPHAIGPALVAIKALSAKYGEPAKEQPK